MDDTNWIHVLQDNLKNVGRGVEIARADNIDSGTFVCHLTVNGQLRSGFFYENGSNSRIAYTNEYNRVLLGTVHKGVFLICFREIVTDRKIRNNQFSGEVQHIQQEWFDDEVQRLVLQELNFMAHEQQEIHDLIALLQSMDINDIRKVKHLINSKKL